LRQTIGSQYPPQTPGRNSVVMGNRRKKKAGGNKKLAIMLQGKYDDKKVPKFMELGNMIQESQVVICLGRAIVLRAEKWRQTSNLEEGKILKFSRAIESLMKYFDKRAENFERTVVSNFDRWLGEQGKAPTSDKKYSALKLLNSLINGEEIDSPLSLGGGRSKFSPVSAAEFSNPMNGRASLQAEFPARKRRNNYAEMPFEMISEESNKQNETIPSVENFSSFEKKTGGENDSVRKRARFNEELETDPFTAPSRNRRKHTATEDKEFSETSNNPKSGGYSMKLNSPMNSIKSGSILKNQSTEQCEIVLRKPGDRTNRCSEQAIDTEISNPSISPNSRKRGSAVAGMTQNEFDEPVVTRERRQVGFNLVNPLMLFVQQSQMVDKTNRDSQAIESVTNLKWPQSKALETKLDTFGLDEASPVPKSISSSEPGPQVMIANPRKLTATSEKDDGVSVTSVGQKMIDGLITGEDTTSSFPPPTRNRRKGTLESQEKSKEAKTTAFEDLERNFNKLEEFLNKKRTEVRRKTKILKPETLGIYMLEAENERLVMSDTEADKRRKIRVQYEEKQSECVTVDDFDFLALLGKGGFGTVWLVRRKSTGDYYALKIIKFHNKSQEFIEGMIKENKIMMSLVGDYVVKGVFSFVYLSYYCVVMDLMVGGDFQKLLGERGAFYEEEAKFYAAELALAVNHIHKQNITHRDLKPDNMLLDNKGHLKLADFGLSNTLEQHHVKQEVADKVDKV
jgi:Protein kinase domain